MWLARRGGEVRRDDRAGHAHPRGAHRARARARAGGHRRRRGLPAARHLRLPVRPHRRARRRAGAWASTRRASRTRWSARASARGRRRAAARATTDRERIRAFAESAGLRRPTFTGYETVEQATEVGAVTQADGRVLAKLVESPFYATGGGQVADAGVVRCEDGGCAARVVDVVRLGDDQALVLEPVEGELQRGRARRRARRPARTASRPRPTTPRRTCCTRRCASGSARTCARPAPTWARTSCASTSRTARR